MNGQICRLDEELMPVATGEVVPDTLREHVAGCSDCQQRIRRLQSEVSVLRLAYPDLADSLVLPAHRDAAEFNDREVAEEFPSSVGRYRVIGLVGRGGQGTVYRAAHPNLPLDLVVKVGGRIAPDTAADRNRLVREGRLLAEIDHPHVARLYDFDFVDERPALVTEYVRGCNLRERFQQQPPTPREAAEWMGKVARGAAAAHAKGVLHLDIKPDNIVLNSDDEPKMIDFGIAQLWNAWAQERELPGTIAGTLGYMAPEQLQGNPPDPRTDVFAMGATLYFLLTGQSPFKGATRRELIDRVAECRIDRGVLRAAGVPRVLVAICLRAMRANPSERYCTAEELAADLERFAKGPHPWRTTVILTIAACLVCGVSWALWQTVMGGPRVSLSDSDRELQSAQLAEHLLGRPLRHDFAVHFELVGQRLNNEGYVELTAGQRVAFLLEPDRDCYVGVWLTADDGAVTQIFPSEFDDDPRVAKGDRRSIPSKDDYAIRATVSDGREYLHIVASTQPWLSEVGQRIGPYVVLTTPAERAQWEERVRGLVVQSENGPSVAEMVVPLRVLPR